MSYLDDLCKRLRWLDRVGPTIASDAADAIEALLEIAREADTLLPERRIMDRVNSITRAK